MTLFEAAIKGNSDFLQSQERDSADFNDLHVLPGSSNWLGYPDLSLLMLAAASPWADTRTLQTLIEQGADPQAKCSIGVTATWFAVSGIRSQLLDPNVADDEASEIDRRTRDVKKLDFLLNHGGDPNECRSEGRSLLCEAASRGDVAATRLLLSRGARHLPDIPPSVEASRRFLAAQEALPPELLVPIDAHNLPLHMAATSGSVECIRILLESGVHPDQRAAGGENALPYAVCREVGEFLVDRGASLDSPGTIYPDLVDHFLLNNSYDLARLILERDPRYHKDGWLDTSTAGYAGVRMDPTALKLFVEFGADLGTPRPYGGGTILHTVGWQHDHYPYNDGADTIETLEFAVEQGIPLEGRDDLGRTALHQAVSGDMPAPIATQTLLRLGANVDAQDNHGSTALMLASELVSLEGIQILLQAGAARDLRDSFGMTALDYLLDGLRIKEMAGYRPNYWLLPLLPAETEELQNSAEAKEALRLLTQ